MRVFILGGQRGPQGSLLLFLSVFPCHLAPAEDPCCPALGSLLLGARLCIKPYKKPMMCRDDVPSTSLFTDEDLEQSEAEKSVRSSSEWVLELGLHPGLSAPKARRDTGRALAAACNLVVSDDPKSFLLTTVLPPATEVWWWSPN
jgi:hypothetical protein